MNERPKAEADTDACINQPVCQNRSVIRKHPEKRFDTECSGRYKEYGGCESKQKSVDYRTVRFLLPLLPQFPGNIGIHADSDADGTCNYQRLQGKCE